LQLIASDDLRYEPFKTCVQRCLDCIGRQLALHTRMQAALAQAFPHFAEMDDLIKSMVKVL
jgi:hypothetical protein